MPAVSIILLLLPAKTASSANNWAPAARAAPWRSFTSRCSTQSMPFWGDIRATPESTRLRTPFRSGQAVAQAAHDTLVYLYPSQKPTFDQELADDLLRVASDRQKSNGVALGKQIAAAHPGFAGWRWLRNTRASSGRRLLHKQPPGTLAAGPNQPDSSRARRALGRMQTIRDKINDSIPSPAAAGPYQRKVYYGL